MHQFEREPASFTPTSYFLKLNSYSVPISYNVSLHRLQFQQNILLVFKICMDVLPTGIYVYYMRAVPTEAIRYPGIEFIDRCEPPYGCWELN